MNDISRLSILEVRTQASGGSVMAQVHAQIEDLTRKESAAGKPYYELRARDGSGSLVLRAWSDTAAFTACESLETGDGVLLEGRFYNNGSFGLDCKQWAVRLLEGDDLENLFAGAPERIDFITDEYEYIRTTVGSIRDPRLQTLSNLFLEEYGDRLLRAAAARSYHHARRGGLVEHVAQMLRSMDAICGAYPRLNRDLCLAGILFHDCGKIWESCPPEKGFTIPYHKAGELLGHISIGIELVNKLWSKLDVEPWKELQPSTEDVRLHLLHLIASHHGEMQFGSPVFPKTPEAIAIHYVDNLDAKLEMFFNGYETATQLAPGIYDRVRPLPANLIKPLDKHIPEPADDEKF